MARKLQLMAKRIFLLAGLIALAAVVAACVKVWNEREERRAKAERAAALAAAPKTKRVPYGPCEDHRPKLPDAPGVGGLEPVVLLFSSDCRWLVSGNDNGSVHAFDRENGRILGKAPAHNTWVRQLLITPDDKYLFSSTHADDAVLIWTLSEMHPVATITTDLVKGSAGNDRFIFRRGNGRDFVYEDGGVDTVLFSSVSERCSITRLASIVRSAAKLSTKEAKCLV